MTEKKTIQIGISIGDINGIGSEIIIKTLSNKAILEEITPVIFGSTRLLTQLSQKLGISININGIRDLDKIINHKINVFNLWLDNIQIQPGRATYAAGKYAFESLEMATKAVLDEKVDVLVTAPINKKNIQSEQFNFKGHTEYLADRWQGKPNMFMVHNELRIALATGHLPVHNIAETLNRELLDEKISFLIESLKKDFLIDKPKIAILGLNPHLGDGGLNGKEDDLIIAPLIKQRFEAGDLVFGPFASDGFFVKDAWRGFDGILAMYHDQGLIPFKYISYGEGVNYTAGLKYIRTSPDHGVAYDIAGKGKACEQSFRNAIYTAIDLYKNRKEYAQQHEDVLQMHHTSKNDVKDEELIEGF